MVEQEIFDPILNRTIRVLWRVSKKDNATCRLGNKVFTAFDRGDGWWSYSVRDRSTCELRYSSKLHPDQASATAALLDEVIKEVRKERESRQCVSCGE